MTELQEREKIGRIVRAALTVFSRRGFHRATMQDIAEEAGVGKGTTYLYFSGKDQLLEHILETALHHYLAHVKQAAQLAVGGPEKIRTLVLRVLEFAQARQDLALFLLEGSTGMSEEFKRKLVSFRDQVHIAVRSIVAAGVEAGEIRPAPPDMLAHFVIGTLNSLVAALLWSPESLAGDGLPAPERTALLAEQVMEAMALAAHPAAPGPGNEAASQA